jgi:hypothetical protein
MHSSVLQSSNWIFKMIKKIKWLSSSHYKWEQAVLDFSSQLNKVCIPINKWTNTLISSTPYSTSFNTSRKLTRQVIPWRCKWYKTNLCSKCKAFNNPKPWIKNYNFLRKHNLQILCKHLNLKTCIPKVFLTNKSSSLRLQV